MHCSFVLENEAEIFSRRILFKKECHVHIEEKMYGDSSETPENLCRTL